MRGRPQPSFRSVGPRVRNLPWENTLSSEKSPRKKRERIYHVRKPANRRWLKMGVELEGGWGIDPRTIAGKVKGAQSKHDGSVRVPEGHAGEVVTRPHQVLDHLCDDVLALHPTFVNNTCGLHIHASFLDLDTSLLTLEEFWTYHRLRWQEWGEKMDQIFTRDERDRFWDRFNGGSDWARRYCKREFKALGQLVDHDADRYTQLNYTAYHKYKTVEIRFLPMFRNSEITISAIREASDIYDTFLTNTPFPSFTYEKEVKNVGDMVVEEHLLVMPDTAPWEEEQVRPGKHVVVGDDVFYHIPGAESEMLPFVPVAE